MYDRDRARPCAPLASAGWEYGQDQPPRVRIYHRVTMDVERWCEDRGPISNGVGLEARLRVAETPDHLPGVLDEPFPVVSRDGGDVEVVVELREVVDLVG